MLEPGERLKYRVNWGQRTYVGFPRIASPSIRPDAPV